MVIRVNARAVHVLCRPVKDLARCTSTHLPAHRPLKARRQLVSNAEFLEFVREGGYRGQAWWSEAGWRWRTFRNAKVCIQAQCAGWAGRAASLLQWGRLALAHCPQRKGADCEAAGTRVVNS